MMASAILVREPLGGKPYVYWGRTAAPPPHVPPRHLADCIGERLHSLWDENEHDGAHRISQYLFVARPGRKASASIPGGSLCISGPAVAVDRPPGGWGKEVGATALW
jgi:hypothetical protein